MASHSYNTETELNAVKQVLEQPNMILDPGIIRMNILHKVKQFNLCLQTMRNVITFNDRKTLLIPS